MNTNTKEAMFPLGCGVQVDRLNRDSYAVLDKLRQHEPVTWIENLGVWYVTRRKDVLEIIENTEIFSNQSDHSLIFDTFGEQMLSIEGPTHRRYKSKMRPPFLPRSVRQTLEPNMVPRVRKLLHGFSDPGRAELRQEFASRLPILTMLDLFGLDAELESSLRSWYDSFEAALSNFERDPKISAVARDNAQQFKQLLQENIDRVRRDPDSALLSALANAEGPDRLTDDEIKRNSLIVFFGGISTVEALILNTMWSLLQHPDVLARVREDDSLIGSAIEETLRWRSPVQSATRHVTRSFIFHGVEFAAGDIVNCMLGSANRDPDCFENPEAFDIDRSNLKDHLAFAAGLHFCLGFHLARTQARVAITELLARFDDIRLDTKYSEVPTGYEFHQPNALHLILASASSK